MANFMKSKEFAVMIDATKGPVIKKVSKSEIDSFIHDVVEGYFEAHQIKPIGGQADLMLLINEDGRRQELQLNPWATVLFSNRGLLDTSFFILGNAVILRKRGVELEPFTKEEANDIALILRR